MVVPVDGPQLKDPGVPLIAAAMPGTLDTQLADAVTLVPVPPLGVYVAVNDAVPPTEQPDGPLTTSVPVPAF